MSSTEFKYNYLKTNPFEDFYVINNYSPLIWGFITNKNFKK